MMQDILARHLGLPEQDVRVICRDVGGSFGIKVHIYPDEMATCALSVMLGQPVKFTADRLESFVSDIHAREHRVKAELAVRRDGTILGMRVDDLTGIGPYSVYPRTSAVEGNQTVRLAPGVYRFRGYAASLRVVFQNKTPMCQYRAVGHPIAFAVMEAMVDRAARELELDPVEMRRKNYVTADMYPHTSQTGYFFERLSHEEALDELLRISDYRTLCAGRDALRARGIYRGLGLCAFIELTTPGPAFYGVGGARISSQDGCTVKLEPSGKLTCLTGVTEQGQGTDTMIAQVVASAVGVALEDVRVLTGDTLVSPYGGGTWASRGAGIGGEAALQTGRALRDNILKVAAAMLQCEPDDLDIRLGKIVDAATGEVRLELPELGRVAYFRPDTLPKDFQSELTVTRHYVPRHQGFAFTNGIQLSHVEVDVQTGFVRLLKHWCVEDCGRIINPRLVDEQIRGAIVQGIGAALYEHLVYDEQGQLLTGTMMDYLVPMAPEMPDIVVGHVETPTAYADGGFKGAGEAGTAGAPGAVLNAVNDALAPLGARVTASPSLPRSCCARWGRSEAFLLWPELFTNRRSARRVGSRRRGAGQRSSCVTRSPESPPPGRCTGRGGPCTLFPWTDLDGSAEGGRRGQRPEWTAPHRGCRGARPVGSSALSAGTGVTRPAACRALGRRPGRRPWQTAMTSTSESIGAPSGIRSVCSMPPAAASPSRRSRTPGPGSPRGWPSWPGRRPPSGSRWQSKCRVAPSSTRSWRTAATSTPSIPSSSTAFGIGRPWPGRKTTAATLSCWPRPCAPSAAPFGRRRRKTRGSRRCVS